MDNKLNEAVRQYARRVKEQYKPKAIYLYGSHAKGTAKEHSDVDIAVVVEPMDVDEYYEMFGKLFSLASGLDASIEPNLLEDDGDYCKYSFLAEVMETGRLIEV